MNKKLLTPLFLAASFLIVGCSTDEIVARPKWIDDPIVNGENGDLKNNKLKEIYDAVKELGDTNANILNKVMYDIAKKQIGNFVELEKIVTTGPSIIDTPEFKKFVDEHPVYKSEDKGGTKDQITGDVTIRALTEQEKKIVSHKKIQQQYDDIIDRIFEKLFNEIKGGSYNTDATFKLFSETEFVHYLEKELYEPNPEGFNLEEGNKVFLPKPSGSNWETYVNYNTTDKGFLHVIGDDYKFTPIYAKEVLDKDDNLIDYDGYIGRKLLPEIYRELLIETYVREQRYTNLGRSYARKVEVLTIPKGEYYNEIDNMLINYVKNNITEPQTGTEIDPLDQLSQAMTGFADIIQQQSSWGDNRKYLEAGRFTKISIPGSSNVEWHPHVTLTGARGTGTTTYVYKGTKLGDIVDKFTKAYDISSSATGHGYGEFGNFSYTPKVPFTEEAKTAYNDLTNNGVYPIDVGIEIKEREALLTDMTQDGWFLKDGGLTDLDETARNRLFNISTARIIDNEEKEYEPGDYVKYFDIEGNPYAYLLKDSGTDEEAIVIDSGSNFHIVRVDEAASSSKLSYESGVNSYLGKKATTADITDSNEKMNKIVRNVTRQVSSSDTYKKNAEQYYLMISNILFYDESVYEYFKSQFPELFK